MNSCNLVPGFIISALSSVLVSMFGERRGRKTNLEKRYYIVYNKKIM
jgi:hypothetical protein